MSMIGALIAGYGPAIAGFKDRFGLSDAEAGAGLALQSIGAVAGVLAAPFVMRWLGNRAAMAASLGLVTFGAAAVSLAPSWQFLLASAGVTGLGVGGIDLLVSQLLIVGTGEKGPALVNLAHAFFGIGTVVSPALIAIVGSGRYPLIFGGIAMCGLAALLTMRGLAARPTPMDGARGAARGLARSSPITGAILLAGFIVLYIAHFGVQSGIGNWEPTYLIALGHEQSLAVWATSGFWLFMVIGRFFAAALTRYVSIPVIVTAGCAGLAAALGLATLDGTAVWAFALCGFFIGPIFPNGLTWLAQSGYALGPSFAYVIAASMVGMALAPWLVGLHIESRGPQVLPATMLTIAAVALLMSGILAAVTGGRRTGRPRRALSPRPRP